MVWHAACKVVGMARTSFFDHVFEGIAGSGPIELGAPVSVRAPYVGNGRYVADEFTGDGWFVVGFIPGNGGDYKLARHPETDWQVIIHSSRVSRV